MRARCSRSTRMRRCSRSGGTRRSRASACARSRRACGMAPPRPTPARPPAQAAARAKEPRNLQVAADARRVEDALRKRLGTDVRVTQKRKGRGLVTISYYSNDDLARLLELILGQPYDG